MIFRNCVKSNVLEKIDKEGFLFWYASQKGRGCATKVDQSIPSEPATLQRRPAQRQGVRRLQYGIARIARRTSHDVFAESHNRQGPTGLDRTGPESIIILAKSLK